MYRGHLKYQDRVFLSDTIDLSISILPIPFDSESGVSDFGRNESSTQTCASLTDLISAFSTAWPMEKMLIGGIKNLGTYMSWSFSSCSSTFLLLSKSKNLKHLMIKNVMHDYDNTTRYFV